MYRPLGVTLLAVGAGLAGLFQIWRMLVFMGVVSFNFIGREVAFDDPQWGQVLWALILAAIWFWVAVGFWNVRGYAWSFGLFVSIFTMIFGFFAVLGGSTTEAETLGWLLSIAIFFYLNYPGVRNVFMEQEMSRLTPEQRAAMENLAAANAAAAAAMAGPAAPAAAAPAAPPSAAPPPPPPTDPTNPAG
jgi:hypothetical protein